ncbi:hypothetical protein HYR82_01185 [Candidatus Peregrinibacteria bacterium]|nr:hypothetical protein [Candidatus Peregrinibacteria bacterium]
MPETRACRISGTSFTATDHDNEFYARMGVPPPTLCPEEMARSRLSFRNETDLYKRSCAKTGKEIITYYPPHASYPIYDKDIWWSDGWDPLSYGRDIDWNRPFFDQFIEMERIVPKSNIYTLDSENCDYTNYATHNKNCYLVFGSWFNENCLYGQSMYHSVSCVDCHYTVKCQQCYECVDCLECYETAFSQNCQSCTSSWFLFDCRNCENCIGCWNLRRKKYRVWNKEVSKEEYESILRKLRTSFAFTELFRQKFLEHVKRDVIHRAMIGENNDNVSGNFIYNSRNVVESYNVQEAQDIYYSDRTLKQKDQYFCTGVHYGEIAFNCLSVDFSHTIICCMNGEHHANTAYCLDCYGVDDCFGCIALRKKKHCILNKQYQKEEYEKVKAKLIEHMRKTREWGEYFPPAMNQFFFNETLAQDYFPLTKGEAIKRGYRWKEEDQKTSVTSATKLPDDVHQAPEDIIDALLTCAETKRPHRITPQELTFDKQFGYPLPRLAWQTRYANRLQQRTPRKLFDRTCAKCSKKIRTTYSPDRPEIVYCEECYLKEVY